MVRMITVQHDAQDLGTITLECVGVVDFLDLIRTIDLDAYERWDSKFHPLRFFSYNGCTTMLLTLHDHRDDDGKSLHAPRVAVFVPTRRANVGWTRPGASKPDKKDLPGAVTDAAIAKWQDSLANRVLVPQWLQLCANKDDLLAGDAKQHLGHCPHCGS